MTRPTIITLAVAAVFAGTSLAQLPTDIPQPAPDAVEAPPAPIIPVATDNDAGAPGRLWFFADYLSGWMQPAHLPSLVTTSPAGTARPSAGVLGLPTTSVLFDGNVNSDVRSGLRVGAGYWLDSERTFGVDVGFSVLESQATIFSASSSGTPILARPFTNPVTGTAQSVVIAFPGSGSGSIFVRDRSENFYDAHVDLTEQILRCNGIRLDGIVGYRFYRYDEGLHIRQSISPTGAAFAAGTQVVTTDDFVAENEFNGFDLGFRLGYQAPRWSLDFLAKCAVGEVGREVKIQGNQVTTVPGVAPVTRTGGVLALSSNIGTFSRREWQPFPEFGANWSWQVTPGILMRLGYSFLFLSDIARAHDQVDLSINPSLFPPATAPTDVNRPAFNAVKSSMWIQTINVGVEFTF
jgi:hypothetical protein